MNGFLDVDMHNGTSSMSIRHDNHNELCPIEDLKVGRWVNTTYDSPPYIPMRGEVQQKTCSDFNPNDPFHTWEWEPEAVQSKGCKFSPQFHNVSYCQLMNNKTIAIIGDSTSFDHYLSLSHLLGVPRALPKAMKKNALSTSLVCNNNSFIIGKRDFYLNSVQDIVDEFFPDVLVLNRGAHYVPDDELLDHIVQNVFPILWNWQQTCMMRNKTCHLIWRTSVPGHPNCTQYLKPSTSLPEMENLVSNGVGLTYNWNQFSVQNELILNALKQSNLTYEVMDAYYLNILRPDMHDGNDCLHTVRTKYDCN